LLSSIQAIDLSQPKEEEGAAVEKVEQASTMVHSKIDLRELILGEKLYTNNLELEFDDKELCILLDSVWTDTFFD